MARFFLDRPVFAWVIAIGMMLAGGLAIYNLPISQYPPIAPPSISIRGVYPGASAKTVEDSVVQIIEQQMTGLDRMLYIHSTSDSSGSAQIELTFAPGTDPDLAWAKVQNKLQLAMPVLPEVVQRQGLRVSKSTRNYLMIVGLTSLDDSLDQNDLSDYAVSQIQYSLARVPGVGEVELFGAGYAMRIWLDPNKLTNYGMTSDDVIAAVRKYNVQVSAGQFGGMPAVPGQRLNASIIVQIAAEDSGGVRCHPAAQQPGRIHRAGSGCGAHRTGHRIRQRPGQIQRTPHIRPSDPAGGRGQRAGNRRRRESQDGRNCPAISRRACRSSIHSTRLRSCE